MYKLAVTALVLTSACATSRGFTTDRDPAPRARIQLELAGQGDTAAVFPAAIDPAVPHVDRIGREVRGTLGDLAVAQIDLCVSPAGKVTKATLVEGSSFADFDQALLRDAAGWQFATQPGPASLQSCERATVSYRPY